jgi:predicted Zn finger-like uncharacterized protein
MIITCPECATRYQADAAKFPSAGRRVKCAKCGHGWHQAPPEPVLDAPAPIEVEPAPPPPPPPPPPQVVIPPAPEEARVPAFAADPDYAQQAFVRPAPQESRVSAFVPDPVYAPPAAETLAETMPRRSALPGNLGLLLGWSLLAAIVVIAGWAAVHYRQTVATLWPQTASFYATLGMPVNSLGIDIVDLTTKRENQDGQVVLAVAGRLANISGRELPVPQLRAALKDGSDRELYHWTFSSGVVTMRPGQSVKFLTRISSPPAGAKGVRVTFAKDGE